MQLRENTDFPTRKRSSEANKFGASHLYVLLLDETLKHCSGVFSSSSHTQSPVRLMQPRRRKEERGLRKYVGGSWLEGDDDIGEEKGKWRQRLWGYFPSCEVASSLSWRLGMVCYWNGITTALRRPMWTNTLAVGKHSREKPARKSKICSEIV